MTTIALILGLVILATAATVIASQALIFFEPMIQSLFRFTDYRQWF